MISFLLLSCSELPCVTPKQARLNIGFYSAINSDTTRLHFDRVVLENENFKGTIFRFKPLEFLDFLRVEMEPNGDSFWLIFKENTQSDSVLVRYKKLPAFISEECGFYNRYPDLEAELHGATRFKSVLVVDPVVDTAFTTHVKIYF